MIQEVFDHITSLSQQYNKKMNTTFRDRRNNPVPDDYTKYPNITWVDEGDGALETGKDFHGEHHNKSDNEFHDFHKLNLDEHQ